MDRPRQETFNSSIGVSDASGSVCGSDARPPMNAAPSARKAGNKVNQTRLKWPFRYSTRQKGLAVKRTITAALFTVSVVFLACGVLLIPEQESVGADALRAEFVGWCFCAIGFTGLTIAAALRRARRPRQRRMDSARSSVGANRSRGRAMTAR